MKLAEQLPEWIAPTKLENKVRAHYAWAWAWFAFGLVGLVDYIWGTEYIANSIPILYFISVYANFTGHLATSQAAKAEIAGNGDTN